VAKRVARVIRYHAAKGTLDMKDFPLLLHIDEILTENAPVVIPWEAFTYEEEV
jgi:glycerol-3-phosphate dehydrogenase (NAD(P)+)